MQDHPQAMPPPPAQAAAGAVQPPGTPPRSRLVARLRSAFRLGLPSKLLLLTVAFVMLAEVLIFLPSIANFRVNWLMDRLTAGHLAGLASEATADSEVPQRLRDDLLMYARVRAIAVKATNRRTIILPADGPLVIDASFDLGQMQNETWSESAQMRLMLLRDALFVFVAPRDRVIRVYGPPSMPKFDGLVVEIVLDESALRTAMMAYAVNILILSIVISIITAALVYFALNRLLVSPMMRLSENMVHFSRMPEDSSRIIVPSGRTDEIGVAERELASMQQQLVQLLHQKSRLAQLGLAVSKINHDLRNMLASAQMMSDRLVAIPDPTVQRFAPKLIAALDRAIEFCNGTLTYGRAQEAPPRREVFRLESLLDDVADSLALPRDTIGWTTRVPDHLTIDADREHLYRVLNNICRNAVDALSGLPDGGTITVEAERVGLATRLVVRDDGPGVPEKARRKMFKAFEGGVRPGGTGLGLAIAAELVRAHGGTIALIEIERGACFEVVIPDRRTTEGVRSLKPGLPA